MKQREREKKKNKKEKRGKKNETIFYIKNFLKSLVKDNKKTLSNLLSTAHIHIHISIFVFNPTPGIKSFDKCDSIILIELSVKFIFAQNYG